MTPRNLHICHDELAYALDHEGQSEILKGCQGKTAPNLLNKASAGHGTERIVNQTVCMIAAPRSGTGNCRVFGQISRKLLVAIVAVCAIDLAMTFG